jgi:hypothetical protein
MDEAMLTTIDIQCELEKLEAPERELVLLAFKYDLPPAYEGCPWPMSLTEVGRFWGMRWHGQAFSEAAIRYKRDAVLARWRTTWGVAEPEKPKKSAKKPKKSKKIASKGRKSRRTSRGRPISKHEKAFRGIVDE